MENSVLVTGGAGFIGSSLVRKLLKIDYSVIVLDNFVNGDKANLQDHQNLTIIEGDITSSEDIKKCLITNPEYVVHLAAYHFIPFCDSHPAETIRVNTYGTQNLLEVISQQNNKIKKIICASTAAVYPPTEAKCREDDKSGPIDIYGISKVSGEEVVNLFNKRTEIPSINARLFNAIGPRETNPHLLPDIIEQLQKGNLDIHLGNLIPKRDYIYVDDISDGIIVLMKSKVNYGNFNIGTGNAHSPKEIIDIIGKVTNKKYNIISVPERQRSGDRPFLLSDNSKLSSLGWKCNYTITEAIEKTLAYYHIV